MPRSETPERPMRTTWVPVHPDLAPTRRSLRAQAPGRSLRPLLIGSAAAVVLAIVVVALVAGPMLARAGESDRTEQYASARAEAVSARDEASSARSDVAAAIATRTETAERMSTALAGAEGYADEAARSTAAQAVAAYADGLGRLELPSEPAAVPETATVETDEDLDRALTALDGAEAEADATIAAVGEARNRMTELDAEFSAALEAFRGSLLPRAEVILGENPDAVEDFRAAVASAAQSAADASDPVQLEQRLKEFASAVDALRADQHRAAIAIEQERLEQEQREAEERERQQTPVVPAPVPTPDPSPEPTPETSPEPTPEPEEPTPTPEDPTPETPAPETPAPDDPTPETPAPDAS
ncbi:hypothetical protein M1D46_06550 [Microbacterium sp. JZ70]